MNTIQAGSGHLAIKLTSIVRSCNSFVRLPTYLFLSFQEIVYFKGDPLFQCLSLSFMGVFIDGFVAVCLLCRTQGRGTQLRM